ncbi:peptidylprolyl isomerase [Sphingomonas lenta]|uniref:peptidylprolyl isomerase n=1 Tax=Sphingomonas lenta TaxID=1141887 RepID=A0A2A2SFI9_9SPHN|nr:peptidylprolyl isomerase [Sphingomonas lenta]PAX08017.1 peptidylprolyl isomerase [Sphingomonas lenta]
MRKLLITAGVALLLGAAPPPGVVRVRLDTSAGPITLALDARRAPVTTANFLAYVDDGRFDGTIFYRAARSKRVAGQGFVQGGIQTNIHRALPPIPLERTDRTGIRHLDATVSMARGQFDASATGNFVLTVGPTSWMDARGAQSGYAAFGRVVGGMDAVERILGQPTCCGTGPMRGQMLVKPVWIVRAVRLDGRPKPSGRPKVWLILERARRG